MKSSSSSSSASLSIEITDLDVASVAGEHHNAPPEKLSVTASAADPVETWSSPRVNLWKYLATLIAFLVLGLSDSAIGALLPYLEVYYDIDYTTVATMFLCPVIGYVTSALILNKMHVHFGQLGIAVVAPALKIIAYFVTCLHPPYPVIPIVFVLVGTGNGLEDGAWNAWIGGLGNTNELMGILHGTYGLGATIGPLVATSMVTRGGLPWYYYYYIMLGCAFLQLAAGALAFRTATAAVFRQTHPARADGKSRTRESLTFRVTWVIAFLLTLYVGVEVGLGGWLVTFMLEVRSGEAFASGLVATGFWLGLTMGRVCLGFATGRIGEKLAIVIYLSTSVALELLFWLIPFFVSSAVFAGLLGFSLGPVFPAAIIILTKLLPARLHVSAVGFVAAIGSAGAAAMPFAIGAIAQVKGVQILQPFSLALIIAILLLWCTLPGGFKKSGMEKMQIKVQEETAIPMSETQPV